MGDAFESGFSATCGVILALVIIFVVLPIIGVVGCAVVAAIGAGMQ